MGTSQSTPEKETASKAMLLAYLDRIGLAADEAEALTARPPNAADVKLLLHKQITSIPFENLGQHRHPATDGVALVPRGRHVPTLNVHETLKKIVFDRRGGFCFELNYAFVWLLRSLGYKVRVSVAAVIMPGGPVAGHMCLLIDGLGEDALLIDPGFGDAPREPMAVKLSVPVTDDMIGDMYTLAPNDDPSKFDQTPEHVKRFNMVLMRSRKKGISSSPMVDVAGMETPPPATEMGAPEPVYLFNSRDDIALDCKEMVDGLAGVLVEAEQNLFSQKRMCIMLREDGFDFVGDKYYKEIRHGVEVKDIS